jgi:AraC family ethanolamine operon transcriptional activator
MQKSVFRDFDEFAEFVRGIEGRFMPTGPSSTEWWVQGSQASRVSVQELQIGGCATFAGTGEPGKLAVGVPMTDARRMRIDATSLGEDSFILMQGAQPFTFTGSGPTRWVGITLPFDHPCLDPRTLEALGAGGSVRKRTQVEYLTHLRGLVNRMLSSDPAVRVATPAAAAALEQDISLAIARVLQFSCGDRETKGRRLHAHHARAVARCLDLIDATQGETLYIEDLARVAAVSERTLRTLFQNYFGVSPIRLLKAKQLWEVRAALLHRKPGEGVLQIAERFGVWDFSLFARDYRALFSELPSETAQAPESELRANASLRWLVYAAKTFHAQAERGT